MASLASELTTKSFSPCVMKINPPSKSFFTWHKILQGSTKKCPILATSNSGIALVHGYNTTIAKTVSLELAAMVVKYIPY